MSLTISNQGNADLPKLAKGVYHGTCFRIVDLGESIQEYKGEKNKRKRVHISFEITEAVDPSDNAVDMDDGRPFAVSKTYTASLFENAALRIDLQAWRGKSFTEEELNGFDIGKLLGCTARIEVGHTEPSDKGAGGNPKILSLQRPDGGIEQDKQTKNDKQKFDLSVYCDEFNGNSNPETKAMCDVFESLPTWHQEEIQKSFEYEAAVEQGADKPVAQSNGGLADLAKDDEKHPDIPF